MAFLAIIFVNAAICPLDKRHRPWLVRSYTRFKSLLKLALDILTKDAGIVNFDAWDGLEHLRIHESAFGLGYCPAKFFCSLDPFLHDLRYILYRFVIRCTVRGTSRQLRDFSDEGVILVTPADYDLILAHLLKFCESNVRIGSAVEHC